MRFPFFDYTKGTFPAAFGHFDDPRVTMSVFSTGKVTIAGVKCIPAAYYAMNKLRDLILPCCPEAKVGRIELQNLTCSLKLGVKIDIARCTRENPTLCLYAPTVFDGMRVKTGVGKICHSVFDEGQVQASGPKSTRSALLSFERCVPLYLRYAAHPVLPQWPPSGG